MDAHLWKLLVDKAVSRTKSRDLLWSQTHEGPANTLSFGTSIDDSTTLNIWGHKTNYSYELCLIKQTAGEPFEERKRVTLKKNAEGIDFSGLFEAAKKQTSDLPRERAFAAVMEYLADPTVKDLEKQDELRDQWGELGDDGYFLYSQDEKILTAARDMTAEGTITWTPEEYSDGAGYFRAEVGELLSFLLQPTQRPGRASGSTSYTFSVSATGDELYADVELNAYSKHEQERALWVIADEIHTIILKSTREEEAKFNKIVRDNIIHDILASLDSPRKEPSSAEGV